MHRPPLLFSFWLACLLVLLGWGRAGAEENCKLQQFAEVDMVADNYGRPSIPVEINGTRVRMRIDTDTALSMMPEAFAPALGLESLWANEKSGLMIGGQRVQRYAKIATMKIGSAVWHSQLVIFNPPDQQPITRALTEDETVGVLSISALSGVDLEFDFQAQKFRLFSTTHCPGHVVYWPAERYAVVSVEASFLGNRYFSLALDGKKLQTAISTQLPKTILNADAAVAIFGLSMPSVGAQPETDSSGCGHCQLMTLATDNLEVRNAPVRVELISIPPRCELLKPVLGAAGRYTCGGVVPLHLGMDVLSRLHLYLASEEKKLYMTLALPPSNAVVPTAPSAPQPH